MEMSKAIDKLREEMYDNSNEIADLRHRFNFHLGVFQQRVGEDLGNLVEEFGQRLDKLENWEYSASEYIEDIEESMGTLGQGK